MFYYPDPSLAFLVLNSQVIPFPLVSTYLPFPPLDDLMDEITLRRIINWNWFKRQSIKPGPLRPDGPAASRSRLNVAVSGNLFSPSILSISNWSLW
jgi:hypothetical protein